MEMTAMLRFLRDLKENNNRDWFHAHKAEYQAANEAFYTVLKELIFELGKTEPQLLQQNPKELTFKMMRDTRFSADKSPYNPALRAHISPKGKLPIPVGYYLMLTPGASFLGGGLFADMFRDATSMVRDAIAKHPEEWEAILSAPTFRQYFTVQGTALKKVPRGYEPEHPQAEYLKNKSWFIEYPLDDSAFNDPQAFLAKAVEVFTAMRPFHAFLNQALAEFQMPQR